MAAKGRAAKAPAPRRSVFERLRAAACEVHFGDSPRANRLRLAVIAIDLAIIGFFIAAPAIRPYHTVYLVADYVIAAVLTLELASRAIAAPDFRDWIRRPIVWVDLFVLLTLLVPQWGYNLGFLRILRLWTLFHSDLFWRTLGRRFDDTRWEEATKTIATFITFLFVMTGIVFTAYVGRAEGLRTYIDALYFTVTTVTTTGFGDVLLPGDLGKLLSIVIMISGITLFVRLAQALFRPNKVTFRCPECGLYKHDPDAVHCKACGHILNIPNAD